jgi:hypothetical protein
MRRLLMLAPPLRTSMSPRFRCSARLECRNHWHRIVCQRSALQGIAKLSDMLSLEWYQKAPKLLTKGFSLSGNSAYLS